MAALKTLEALALGPASSAAVGTEPGQDWAHLVRRRAAWAALFAREAGAPGAPLAFHGPDALECAAALLAAWGQGRSVVLPGDDTPATLGGLAERGLKRFGGEAPPDGVASAAPDRPFPGIPVVVFTSGSTGAPLAAEKPRACVESELAHLEQAFGADLEGARVLATVPHQHYYGLLFRLLWPLAAGRPFSARRLETPEALAAACAGPGRFALVSSPALLKRLPSAAAFREAMAPWRGRLAAVYSSGGPLPWEAARGCRELFGQDPVEVYGSSETGGVAWRRRSRDAEPFVPLPGVEAAVDADGSLSVRSAHLPGGGWTRCEDRAEAAGPGFLLLGRADRVAKIEEKRVSLAALERGLEAHPDVAEARVLVLPGERDVLGAVVRLRGGVPGDAEARRDKARDLRALLAERAEAVALPRRWRFVEALPGDAMGKTALAALEALFQDGEVREPEVLALRRSAAGVDLDLGLPEGLLWFRGHFPGRPLLPGVVQLHWAVAAARRHLALEGDFKGLRVLKFTRPLEPGRRVTLSLAPEPGGFAFEYASDLGRHAQGRVLLG